MFSEGQNRGVRGERENTNTDKKKKSKCDKEKPEALIADYFTNLDCEDPRLSLALPLNLKTTTLIPTYGLHRRDILSHQFATGPVSFRSTS